MYFFKLTFPAQLKFLLFHWSPQIFSLIVKSTDGKWNMKQIIIFYWTYSLIRWISRVELDPIQALR
jgi:hypothetical protein